MILRGISAGLAVVGLICVSGVAIAGGDDGIAAPSISFQSVTLRPGQHVQHHHAQAQTNQAARTIETGPTETIAAPILVYSNTLGKEVFAVPGSSPLVTDDLTLFAAGSCNLDHYVVMVDGDPLGVGDLGPFSVDVALYPVCPDATHLVDPPPIEGTQCRFEKLLGSGLHALDCSIANEVSVEIPNNIFIGLRFEQEGRGIVFGAPAVTGYTRTSTSFQDVSCNIDFVHDQHAGFHVEIYAREPCVRAYPGYLNSDHAEQLISQGVGIRIADDLELQTNDCLLIGYEVTAKGASALVNGTIRADLRTALDNADPDNGSVIEGTQHSFFVFGDAPQIHRFVVDPPILIPQNLWITFDSNNSSVGPILTERQAFIGQTKNTMSRFFNGQWELFTLPSFNVHGALDVTIFCAGGPEPGACCDTILHDELGEATCRVVAEMNCPNNRWMPQVTCDPDPFSPVCGLSACCKPDDTCQNLTQNECEALVPEGQRISWQRNSFCGDLSQFCPFFACVRRVGNCSSGHEVTGCSDPRCCDTVCGFDPFCCAVTWDEACVRWASEFCRDEPANDECMDEDPEQGATPLTEGIPLPFSNVRATQATSDPVFPCDCDNPGGQAEATTWFSFQATQSAMRLSMCDSFQFNADTILRVFHAADPSTPTSACESLEPIDCNDDSEGCGEGRLSGVCLTELTIGDTYYALVGSKPPIRVCRGGKRNGRRCDPQVACPCDPDEACLCNPDAGVCRDGNLCSVAHQNCFDGSQCEQLIDCPSLGQCVLKGNTGVFTLSLTNACSAEADPPPNDTCSTAIAVAGGAEPFSFAGATQECPRPDCLPSSERDLWYEWVAPALGFATVSASSGDTSSTSGVFVTAYDGSDCPVDEASVLACAGSGIGIDDGGSSLTFPVQAGMCYKIRLGSQFDGPTEGLLSIDLNECLQGSVIFRDPTSGLLDARQPWSPENPETKQGLREFNVTGPSGVEMVECWSVCESVPATTANHVEKITLNDDGSVTLQLARAIRPGAVTQLSYRAGSGVSSHGQWTFHPGNIDGDLFVNSENLVTLLIWLNGLPNPPPVGLLSKDIDRSGQFAAADLLRLIDLLNGAQGYDVWLGTSKPDLGACEP